MSGTSKSSTRRRKTRNRAQQRRRPDYDSDQNGNVLRRARPAEYFSSVSLCRWPNREGKKNLLAAGEGRTWLLDFDGSTFQNDQKLIYQEVPANSCQALSPIRKALGDRGPPGRCAGLGLEIHPRPGACGAEPLRTDETDRDDRNGTTEPE